jgi:hypothetical protein
MVGRAGLIAAGACLTMSCGGSGPKPGEAPTPVAAEAAPCTVIPADAADPWREVKGKGFTFCVPATWRVAGSTEMRNPQGGSISWGESENRARVPFAVGKITSTGPVLPNAPPSDMLPQQEQFAEAIGGQVARLSVTKFNNNLTTSATWTSPFPLQLRGEGRVATGPDLHLKIYRTVRFTER